MNILDRVEQSFERLVEGSIGRIFRSPLQPAEIGRKLERAMEQNARVSVGTAIVPNEYRVAMHPDDAREFAGYRAGLSRQMEGWLGDLARERGFTMVDAPHVELVEDAAVPRRAIQVTATITDRPRAKAAAKHAGTAQATELFRVARPPAAAVPSLRLRYSAGGKSGQELTVRKPVTTVGRSLDNDLVLESGDISRHHAEIVHDSAGFRVVDLGSTNGTQVNGSRLGAGESRPIGHGDELRFGSTTVRVLGVAAS